MCQKMKSVANWANWKVLAPQRGQQSIYEKQHPGITRELFEAHKRHAAT